MEGPGTIVSFETRFSAFFVIAAALTTTPAPSNAQTAVDACATVAPPPLPDYEQPPIPAPGYIWTPGYWGWGEEGYYWVPGIGWNRPRSACSGHRDIGP